MTFAINLITRPKSGDLYKEVAVNSAPFFIKCSDEERLKSILHNDENIVKMMKSLLKTPSLYSHAKYCARCVEQPDKIIYIEK